MSQNQTPDELSVLASLVVRRRRCQPHRERDTLTHVRIHTCKDIRALSREQTTGSELGASRILLLTFLVRVTLHRVKVFRNHGV